MTLAIHGIAPSDCVDAGNMGSHGTILKTTGVVGARRIFTILANLVKTKVIASILGPAGTVIYGLYPSIAGMVVGSAIWALPKAVSGRSRWPIRKRISNAWPSFAG